MKRWVLALCCMMLAGVAFANGRDEMRERVQASMLVTGTIEVARDGSVVTYAVDHPDKLPSVVKDLLARAVPAWKFEPVTREGKAVGAKAPMGLRVVAKPVGHGGYAFAVTSSWFGHFNDSGKHGTAADDFTYKRRLPVAYPSDAAGARVSGTVYALLKVGRDGKVIEAVAEQVNLRIRASEREMAAWRKKLADAALRSLRRYTFHVPTAGPDAAEPYWIAGVPVDFVLDGFYAPKAAREAEYGQWQPYVPGPVQAPAWVDKRRLAGSPDATPEDGSLLADMSLHLLTPLGGS
jgi:hypothetical protein